MYPGGNTTRLCLFCSIVPINCFKLINIAYADQNKKSQKKEEIFFNYMIIRLLNLDNKDYRSKSHTINYISHPG